MKKLGLCLALFTHLFASSPLTTSYNQTAFALFDTLNEDDNCVISPLSINTCLYMAYMGAKGATADAMANALFITTPKETIPPAFDTLYTSLEGIHIANSLWIDDHFAILPSYEDLITKTFHGVSSRVSFANPPLATNTINKWVADQTEGAIEKLFGPDDLDRNTRLVLTNAIYFKGGWRFPFMEGATNASPFYTLDNDRIDVDMMNQKNRFSYFESDEAQYIALPFHNSTLSMVVYLPKDTTFALTEEDLMAAIDRMQPRHINLDLPKFKTKYKTSLVNAFKALSMDIAFTPRADFSDISGKRDLFISNIVHEALFECDEKGVVAAAATGVVVNKTSLMPEPETTLFRANHPFLYFLVDMDTKTVFFMGQLLRPE